MPLIKRTSSSQMIKHFTTNLRNTGSEHWQNWMEKPKPVTRHSQCSFLGYHQNKTYREGAEDPDDRNNLAQHTFREDATNTRTCPPNVQRTRVDTHCVWKLNNTFLYSPWVKDGITVEIVEYFKVNNHQTQPDQNVRDAAATLLTGHSRVWNTQVTKSSPLPITQASNLEHQKEQKLNPKNRNQNIKPKKKKNRGKKGKKLVREKI